MFANMAAFRRRRSGSRRRIPWKCSTAVTSQTPEAPASTAAASPCARLGGCWRRRGSCRSARTARSICPTDCKAAAPAHRDAPCSTPIRRRQILPRQADHALPPWRGVCGLRASRLRRLTQNMVGSHRVPRYWIARKYPCRISPRYRRRRGAGIHPGLAGPEFARGCAAAAASARPYHSFRYRMSAVSASRGNVSSRTAKTITFPALPEASNSRCGSALNAPAYRHRCRGHTAHSHGRRLPAWDHARYRPRRRHRGPACREWSPDRRRAGCPDG